MAEEALSQFGHWKSAAGMWGAKTLPLTFSTQCQVPLVSQPICQLILPLSYFFFCAFVFAQEFSSEFQYSLLDILFQVMIIYFVIFIHFFEENWFPKSLTGHFEPSLSLPVFFFFLNQWLTGLFSAEIYTYFYININFYIIKYLLQILYNDLQLNII